MAYPALLLLLDAPVKAIQTFVSVVIIAVFERMKQVKIKIINTRALTLLLKYPVPVFKRFHAPRGQFGGNIKILTRIALNNALFCRNFGLSAMINVSCIEIIQPRLHVSIDHITDPLQVNFIVLLRQTHQPETEFRHFFHINIHIHSLPVKYFHSL